MFKTKRFLMAGAFMAAVLLNFTGCGSTAKAKGGTPLQFDSAITRGNLENGMTYFVQRNTVPANRITLRLIVRAGSVNEEDDQKGVAHFIEHLAFNGTEHFKKSDIVDYFEKIGMNFGADLNAYTTFEQTVYQLEVPADDPEMLKTALLILHDWACAVSFEQSEIDKERGVVQEEWRLRQQNLNGRVGDKETEIALHDSRFEDRLPIGDMNIIKTVSRERIVDFYKKWYRPEFMSVAIVGDERPEVMEAAVKEAMSEIPASDGTIVHPEYSVPLMEEKSVQIMKDPEQAYTTTFIFNSSEPYVFRATEEDYKPVLGEEILAGIFNARLAEITNTPDAPWLFAATSDAFFTNHTCCTYLALISKPGMLSQAQKLLFDEVEKLIKYGVEDSELGRVKKQIMSQVQLYYQNKEKQESSSLVTRMIDYVTCGKIPVSPEDYLRIHGDVLPQITTKYIKELAEELLASRGDAMLVLAPVSEQLPSEAEILENWTSYKAEKVTAYKDDVSDTELMKKPAKKGAVVSRKNIPELGCTEYILDNGIRIIVRIANYELNTMYMSVQSKGGMYALDQDLVPCAFVAPAYMIYSGMGDMTFNQLSKKLQSKTVNFNLDIGNTTEYFTGSCDVKDSEAMLQILNLCFTKPAFTAAGWNTLMPGVKAQADSFGSEPEQVFNAQITEMLYGKNNIYFEPLNADKFAKFDAEKAEKAYKDRFANPADFTYVFAGHFDEDDFIDLCCYYLGSLKTSADREETVYKYWDFPKGKPSATVTKGIGEKGEVFMEFGGTLPAQADMEESYKESVIMSQLTALLDIRLREVIREDKGGSYGVNVNGYIDGWPERFYRMSVDFGCDPEREQELKEAVISVVKELQEKPVDQLYIDKLTETLKRNQETNRFDNNWWINRINAELVFEYEPLWVSSNIYNTMDYVTAENLQAAAKKYLNTDNYISVFLVPEGK